MRQLLQQYEITQLITKLTNNQINYEILQADTNMALTCKDQYFYITCNVDEN